jgi:hypothetical protein
MCNQAAKFLTLTMLASGLAFLFSTSCTSNSGARPMGAGGSTGAGGVTGGGTGGSGGDCTITACPAAGVFDCTQPVTPTNTLITDFGTCTWHNTAGKFGLCPITGSPYTYAGPTAVDGAAMSVASKSADLTAQNMEFMATVEAGGGYAGFGLQFDECVDLSNFHGVQFTLIGTTGGCDLQLQFQTFEQRPTTQNPPGSCDSTAGSCYGYPAQLQLQQPPDMTTPITVQVMFANVTNWTATTAKEVVGLQWQLTVPAPPDGGTQITCAADLRFDDVALIP